MDPLSQNQSGAAMPNKQQIDFGAMHSAPHSSSTNQTTQSSTSQQSAPQPQPQPTPVTSAKAAINAMYAEQAKHPQPPIVMSAREAVNAAAGQAGAQQTKSAANLHHGSIQRSMESTRTSKLTRVLVRLTRLRNRNQLALRNVLSVKSRSSVPRLNLVPQPVRSPHRLFCRPMHAWLGLPV